MTRLVPRSLCLILATLLCMPFSTRASATQGVQLLLSERELPGSLLPDQWRRMEDLIRRPVLDVDIYRGRPIDEYESLLRQAGPAFEIDLRDDLKLAKLSVTQGSFGEHLVRFDRGEGRFTLDANGLYGHVITDGKFYAVASLGGGKLVVEEVPFSAYAGPNADASDYGPPPPPATNPACSADTSPSILMLASSSVMTSESELETKAKLELSSINSALENSGVNGAVTLAGVGIIDFTSSASLTHDARTLSQDVEVKQLRAKTGADLVFLITDHDGGGAARQILAGRDAAFALISSNNLNHPRYSVAHEFGHLLGAGHEAVQKATHPDLPYATAFVPLPQAKEKWCELMAVTTSCQGRELVFSNPGHWRHVKVGRDHDRVHNTRAIREHFLHAAKFNCAP